MDPDDLDGNMELDSSDSSTTLDDATATSAADGASSSDAHGETGEADLLSVVRDVADQSRQASADAAPPAEGDGTGETGDGAEQPKEPDNENFSDVPFNKHPRFQQLVRQRNEFKVDADRYRNVQNFLDQNGLTPEETADGLVIMGLMKTNPQEAWARLRPTIENLMIAAGELLPNDLRQRVQGGEITAETALEISRARAGQASIEARMQHEAQFAQRRQQAEAVRSIQTAATGWESDRQAKDPNFAAKIEPLRREIAYLQHVEGIPNSAEGVKDQLNRAYAAVNKALPPKTPVQPTTRRPVQPLPRGQGAANARPEVKSTLDIIRASRA